jgi:hypothetical protein
MFNFINIQFPQNHSITKTPQIQRKLMAITVVSKAMSKALRRFQKRLAFEIYFK